MAGHHRDDTSGDVTRQHIFCKPTIYFLMDFRRRLSDFWIMILSASFPKYSWQLSTCVAMICDKLSSNSTMSGQEVLTKGLLFDVPALFNSKTSVLLDYNPSFLLGIVAFFCFTFAVAPYRFSRSHKCHLLHRLELLLFQTVWRFCNKQSISIFTSVSVPVVQSHSYSGTFKVFLWSGSIVSSPGDKVFCFLWCQLLLIVHFGGIRNCIWGLFNIILFCHPVNS